ncbi:ABC transporter permease [Planctomycetes bacterium K23_9]|uniref:ABC-2 family transporter protein n=1 Tax=Stieleria marina TaxID=1930275 RepID=A0A517NN05_9BACT|nr:ABC-2 family transporter protein [Planctomycetes bacterium K23_9]
MNPVVQREFYGILRSPKAFAILMALSAIFAMAVLLRWPSSGTVDLSGTQSMEVFRILGYGLLAGVVFLVPAFPATSIVNEKSSGTLALLLNSPLSPWAIYFGKISGVLLFSVLVLLSSLPAAAACYAMGGIDLVSQLGLLYVVLVLLSLQYATLGMFVSSLVQSADAGVRVTYAAVLGLFVFSLIPALLTRGSQATASISAVTSWVRNLSPLPAVMEIMGHGSVGSSGLRDVPNLTGFAVVTIASSVVFALLTLSRMNYRIFDRSRSQGIITNDRTLASRTFRRLFYLVDPQRRKAGIPWYMNPIMVKEFRSRRFGRSQWLIRLVCVCAVISMVLTFLAATSVTAWGVDSIGGLLVLMQVMLVVLLAPSLASGLISSERDGGGWELLRATPLSPLKILSGKMLSAAWTLALVLLATLPGYLMMIYIRPTMWLQVQLVLISLLWTTVLALTTSAAVGSLFRLTAVSTAVTYVVIVGLFLTPILFWLGRDAPFGHNLVEKALLITPVGAALSVINAPGFASYDLLPAAWYVAGIVSFFMLVILGIQTWRLTRSV